MKTSLIALFTFATVATYAQVQSELTFPPNGDNERAEISQWMGLVKVTIAYHSPDVHGPAGNDRKNHIWGDLVHYGFIDQEFGPSKSGPWRAGANESTTISFSHDVKIGDKNVKAGTYALFLDVEKEGPWTWILSSQIGWGSYQYDSKYDVCRVSSTPEEGSYAEWLTYGFDDRKPSSTVAFLQWENKKTGFKIEVPNMTDLYVNQMRQDLLGWAGFNYQNWARAAAFCAANKVNLEEALVWADKAIDETFRGATFGSAEFTTYLAKAQVLTALGRDAEAASLMDEALQFPGTHTWYLYQYTRSLLGSGKKDKALVVGLINQKRYPGEPFWTYYGLAWTYVALGDKKNATKNWEIASKNIPPSQRPRTARFENDLKNMKDSK